MAEPATMCRAAVVLALLLLTSLPLAQPAEGRVQDYQIVRLLSYKTSCQLAKLEDRSAPTGPRRFFALCDNLTAYPDGIDIVCADRDDDRSCTVMTRERTFDGLHLLDRPR